MLAFRRQHVTWGSWRSTSAPVPGGEDHSAKAIGRAAIDEQGRPLGAVFEPFQRPASSMVTGALPARLEHLRGARERAPRCRGSARAPRALGPPSRPWGCPGWLSGLVPVRVWLAGWVPLPLGVGVPVSPLPLSYPLPARFGGPDSDRTCDRRIVRPIWTEDRAYRGWHPIDLSAIRRRSPRPLLTGEERLGTGSENVGPCSEQASSWETSVR